MKVAVRKTVWLKSLAFEGDSLTLGVGAAAGLSWPAQFLALAAADGKTGISSSNLAGSGNTIVDMLTQMATVDALYVAGKRNIAVLWAGTNDLYHTSASAATIYANLTTWTTGRQAAGFAVTLLTLLPCTYGGTPLDYESRRQTLNPLIVGNAAGAETVVNIAADVRLADSDNATYFADKLHLTAAGYGVVAELVYAALSSQL